MDIKTTDLCQLLQVIEAKEISISEVIALINHHTNTNVKSMLANDVINLTVDCGKTLEQMIAAGRYDSSDSNITEENFSLSPESSDKKERTLAVLLHYNQDVNSEDVISDMDRVGYRPATLVELLALGEANPFLQRRFPIIALGSVWTHKSGNRLAPVLDVDEDGKRRLVVYWYDGGWSSQHRFLVVRKNLLATSCSTLVSP